MKNSKSKAYKLVNQFFPTKTVTNNWLEHKPEILPFHIREPDYHTIIGNQVSIVCEHLKCEGYDTQEKVYDLAKGAFTAIATSIANFPNREELDKIVKVSISYIGKISQKSKTPPKDLLFSVRRSLLAIFLFAHEAPQLDDFIGEDELKLLHILAALVLVESVREDSDPLIIIEEFNHFSFLLSHIYQNQKISIERLSKSIGTQPAPVETHFQAPISDLLRSIGSKGGKRSAQRWKPIKEKSISITKNFYKAWNNTYAPRAGELAYFIRLKLLQDSEIENNLVPTEAKIKDWIKDYCPIKARKPGSPPRENKYKEELMKLIGI